jgi:hypothetical protein
MRFYESEDTSRTDITRVGCIPRGTFYGTELVPPGTFH